MLGAVLVATLLTGCGGQDAVLEQHAEAEATSSPETTEVPAFHFESGTLELGDFDPQTLGDDLFDPCTEISEEEFAAAGITGVENEPALYRGNAQGCRTDQPEPAVTRTVIGARTTSEDAANAADYEFSFVESSVDGMYTFKNPIANPYMCIAQVDTQRGGLAIGISVSGLKKEKIDPCKVAVSELSNLYRSINNG
ncbi:MULTISPECIES: DUF3558 family protein [Corynebacterium]|uniref:DUF3558 family protein n=1 Tax=Corynebacterium TaxID=1716 RepID=UPI0013140CC9|nr:DUF3558 family protein [Corynebacterium hadale]